VRVASLPLTIGSPIAPTHPTAVVVTAVLAVLVVSVGRRARPRFVGPLGTVLGLLGDLVGGLVCVVANALLPHAVLLVLALVDLVTSTRGARRHRPAESGEAGCVGFTNGCPRPRRARREHRDR
jgi:hypothetical protein